MGVEADAFDIWSGAGGDMALEGAYEVRVHALFADGGYIGWKGGARGTHFGCSRGMYSRLRCVLVCVLVFGGFTPDQSPWWKSGQSIVIPCLGAEL